MPTVDRDRGAVVSARLHPRVEVEGELLVLRDARCVLVVRVEEVLRFVKADRMRWAAAVRRGKWYQRARDAARRERGRQ